MQVSWWVELAVRPGCLDAFETLTGEMVAAAHAEGGVLAYQRFISDDRQTVHVHECYEIRTRRRRISSNSPPCSVTVTRAWSSGSVLLCSASQARRCAPCWTPTEPAITRRLDHSVTGADRCPPIVGWGMRTSPHTAACSRRRGGATARHRSGAAPDARPYRRGWRPGGRVGCRGAPELCPGRRSAGAHSAARAGSLTCRNRRHLRGWSWVWRGGSRPRRGQRRPTGQVDPGRDYQDRGPRHL
jgi:hypothetical protein